MSMFPDLPARRLFLIDGLGALLTAFLLSQVLARWEQWFGMPRSVLFVLAALAAGFAVYSLTCHFLQPANWRPFLRAIALANTLYCVLTATLVVYLFDTLTWLGIAYFLGEILLVMGLVSWEFKTIQTKLDPPQ